MVPLIVRHEHEIVDACRKHGVVRLVVFGSAATNQDFGPSSDIDCVVEFNHADPLDYGRAFFALLADLQAILNRPIDLITERSIRNPAFRAEISEKGQLLYAA